MPRSLQLSQKNRKNQKNILTNWPSYVIMLSIINAVKRNSTQKFRLGRDAGWCEALGKLCRTHRGAAAVKFSVGADGSSRHRVKMCLHLRASYSDEEEWYRGKLSMILTFSSL